MTRQLLLALALFVYSAGCATPGVAEPEDAEHRAPDDPPPAAEPQPDAEAPPRHPDPETDALLDRLEAAAAQVQTLQARLRYDRIQGLLGDRQRRFGELRYAAGPPPRFDARFDKLLVDGAARRVDLRFTFDGYWLAERDGEDRTFTRRQLVPEDEPAVALELGESPFALPLNARKQEVLARFEVARVEPAEQDPDNTLHLMLTPREHVRIDPTRIDLWYDADSLLPVRVRTENESQSVTEIDLLDPEVNVELDADAFDTQPPRGRKWQVQVIPLEEG